MYQWVESKKTTSKRNSGGGVTKTTTYTYTKKWDKFEHNSDNFKKTQYKNPKFNFRSKHIGAQTAKLGNFNITETQALKMTNFTKFDQSIPAKGFKIVDGVYYKSDNPSNPNIGDLKITYYKIPSGAEVSIVGQQNNDNTIGRMPTNVGSIYVQYDGIFTHDEILDKFQQHNTILSFGIRILGFLVMLFGLNLLLSPIKAVARFIPYLDEIIGFISGIILAVVALGLSLITIAIAWFAYRPILSLILLIIIGGLTYFLRNYYKNKPVMK